MRITDIQNTAWRNALMPASFRGAFFHVEMGAQHNGRRIVLHEFPKSDVPYPEDLGRRAKLFVVRGYCIAYPSDAAGTVLLYQRDYRPARNALINALEEEGPALLQLPTIPPVLVVAADYRWTEEERLGGYCVFDMQFLEYGVPRGDESEAADTALLEEADALKKQVAAVMATVDSITAQQKLAGRPQTFLFGRTSP